VLQSNAFPLAVTASLVAHLALLLAVPGFRISLPVAVERLIEVEIAPPAPAESLVQPKPQPADPLEAPPTPSPKPLTEPSQESLAEALFQSVPRPAAPAPAPVPIRLPERGLRLPEPDAIVWRPTPPTRQRISPAEVRGIAPAAPDLDSVQQLAKGLLQDLAAPPTTDPLRPPAPLPRLEIEGPVGTQRNVVLEPPLPRVEIRNPADVRIRFWVSPRGTVTRTELEQMADPALDGAALAYIKGFRFNALPPGETREQWGTIRVRFRLE
jgi:TonB family protein